MVSIGKKANGILGIGELEEPEGGPLTLCDLEQADRNTEEADGHQDTDDDAALAIGKLHDT